MSHRLGMHWMRHHEDGSEFDHIRRMGYRSIKVFEEVWSDKGVCDQILNAAPQDCLFLLRDHPLSEQKGDMYSKPAETGFRHADEWAEKFNSNRIFLPRSRSYCLGINEPESNSYQQAINLYTAAFLRRLHSHDLWGGAFNFSVGHPSTEIDPATGRPNPSGTPDWHWYEDAHQAIVEGGHLVVLHEYGLPGNYGWGFWCNRLKYCPWQDIKIIIGECGVDGGLADRPQTGWAGYGMGQAEYTAWLNEYMSALDSRVHSFQPFTWDYAHPWSSFDVAPLRHIWEVYPWTDAPQAPVDPPTPIEPPAQTGKLTRPLAGAYTISQHFYQNPQNYAQFGLPGHNGTDLAAIEGMPVLAIADGEIAFTGVDVDYGNYCRIWHQQFGAHSFYAHLKELPTAAGDIKAGRQIGLVGTTGNSTGPHLHLEIRLGDENGYSNLTPMSKGRVDAETWLAERGLKL